jgi:hypothetical protein
MPLRPLIHRDDTQLYFQKCCDISPRIALYFAEGEYLQSTENKEQINPEYLCNIAIGMLIEDLHELGLDLPEGITNVVTSKHDLEVLLALRRKFDRQNLTLFLKHRDEKILTTIRDMTDHAADLSELVRDVIQYFHQLYPLDMGYDLLFASMTRITSSMRFRDHLSACCKMARSLDVAPVIHEANMDLILWYINFVDKARADIYRCYWKVMRADPSLDRTLFLDDYAKHDLDLVTPDLLDAMAQYRWNEVHQIEPNPKPTYYATVHRRRNLHHPDVYLKDGMMDIDNVPKEALAMILCDDVTPTTTKETLMGKAAMLIKTFNTQSPSYNATVDFVYKIVEILLTPDQVEG